MQLFKTGGESVGLKIKEPRGTKKRVAMGEKRECLSFKLLHTSPRNGYFKQGILCGVMKLSSSVRLSHNSRHC